MKKVGILTFQNAHNWGAALQAWALKKYIKSLGFEVTVINYKNSIIESNYLYNRKIRLKKVRYNIFKYAFLQIEKLYSKNQYLEKWKKFNKFIQELTDNEEAFFDAKKIEKMSFDYIICGSDQIWNYTLTGGLDKMYFCDFNTNAIKISYAASMGIKKLPEEKEKEFQKYLDNFDFISVREESLNKYASTLTKKKIETVVDPTLLLKKDDYLQLEQKNDFGHYLLLYTLVDDKKLKIISNYIAQKLNLKIIELRYEKTLKRTNGEQVANVGPEEFLGLINNADFVITNSFHGTIFSIIFNKPFYTIKIKSVNSRIENILKITQLEDRCIEKKDDVDLNSKIDFNTAIKNIEKNSQSSKDFLKKALK